MAVVVHYCDKCGIRIEPEELDEGKAAIIEGKAFCSSCTKKLSSTALRPKIVKPISKRKPPARSAPVRKKTTTAMVRRSKPGDRVDEYEEDSRPQIPAPVKKKSALPLVLGIAGVLLVVIIIIAVSAGGSGRPERESRISEELPQPRGYAPPAREPQPVKPDEPHPQPPPAVSTTQRRYEEALAYGRSHPEEYAEMVDRLEAITREESVGFRLADRIQLTISEWMGRWEQVARQEWERTTTAAQKLAENGDHEAAAKLWDSFPEKFKSFGSYGEESEAEAKRLRKLKDALAALSDIENDIKAAEKDFTVEQIEEAEKLLDKLCEFGGKYDDVDFVVEKLRPAVTKLREQIQKLEQEKFTKELEEFNKKQEEERRKQEQERWTALKTFWQTFYGQYDQNAGVLTIGSHVLYDGSSLKGWAAAVRNENATWTGNTGVIQGTNRGTVNAVLIPQYKQAYFWENYTITMKIRVAAGSCSMAVRTNVNQQNQISGTMFQVGGGGQWIEMKIEVKGDAATTYVNGQQTAAMNTNYPAGYPSIFLPPNSQVELKDVIFDLKSTRN